MLNLAVVGLAEWCNIRTMHLSHSFRVTILSIALSTTAGVARADESAKFVASDGTSTSITAPTITSKLKAAGQKLLDRTENVTEYALGMLGIQYKFGGNSPDSGFDCSGLVRYVFAQVTGLSLPHNAAEQSKVGREVSMEELRPGDLVFFNTRKFFKIEAWEKRKERSSLCAV